MPHNKKVSFYMERELKRYTSPEAKNFFLCTWYRYMFPYIPYRTGLMASLMAIPEDKATQSTKLSPEEAMRIGLENIRNDPQNVIHFKAPYANRQYEGTNFNFTRDIHPLSMAHWAQVAADLHGEQIMKEFKGYVERSKNK